mmetsp:Transcript_71733/g.171393  ORF Transcript_71733/g.171393 Transcript_71733/m.171393 type:complete len:315 (+) Transcript_71733:100-1044(+)
MPGLESSLREVLDSLLSPHAKPQKVHAVEALASAAVPPLHRAQRRALWMAALPAAKPLRTAFEVDRDNAPALEEMNNEAKGKEKDQPLPPMWENLDGLPEVKVTSPAVAYFSKDIGAGEDGEMKPTFGCKCGAGDWRPAMSHPSITFRQEFVDLHPDFLGRVQKLRINLVNDNTQKTQWDATYDLLRFLKSGDVPTLTETTPAIPGSGTQLRFLTFCPEAAQNYTLKVTALDSNGDPIDYFEDDEMHLNATPGPPPPAEEKEPDLPNVKEAEKMAEEALVKEPGLESGGLKTEEEEPPEEGDITREIMHEESLE